MDITPFIKLEEKSPPKDATFLILLVKANKDNWYSTEYNEFFRTIGFNGYDNTGDDTWYCAGWSWCHDEIVEKTLGRTVETIGEIIGWMYMPEPVFMQNK